MAHYELLITDVTNYGTLFCVAGQTTEGVMVRPEPHTARATNEASRFWSAVDAGPGRFFDLGNVVRFEANEPPAAFPFPHANEDRIVVLGSPREIVDKVKHLDLPARAKASVSHSLSAAFDNALVQAPSGKPYVMKDSPGRSLGAIEVATKTLHFHLNTYDPQKPKLRAYLAEGNAHFDLPVTSDEIHRVWKQHGLKALSDALKNFTRAHLRVGLSRPFGGRPECYAQINGIFFHNE